MEGKRVAVTPGRLETPAMESFLCMSPRRRSHWDGVRLATLRQDLKRQQKHGDFPVKLRVAMVTVRATMSREEALDTLNGAGFLSLSRRVSVTASGIVQLFAPPASGRKPEGRKLEPSTSRCSRCLSCLPAARRNTINQPQLRPASMPVTRGKAKSLPAGADRFCSTWCPVEDENYDAYLAELGLTWSLRMLAASLRPQPTYTIEDGVLHGRTEGVGGQIMHDTFATGVDIPISMMGYAVLVQYTWEGGTSPVLLAKITSPDGKLAGGKPISVRRWVESSTAQLHAESTCGGVTCLRRYDVVAAPEARS